MESFVFVECASAPLQCSAKNFFVKEYIINQNYLRVNYYKKIYFSISLILFLYLEVIGTTFDSRNLFQLKFLQIILTVYTEPSFKYLNSVPSRADKIKLNLELMICNKVETGRKDFVENLYIFGSSILFHYIILT